MKFLIFILFSLSLHAEVGTYLYTRNTRCVFDLQPNLNNNGFCYRYFTSPNNLRCTRTAKITQFVKGYDYNQSTNRCELEHDLRITGLNKESHSNIMIYLSIAFSFIFLQHYLSWSFRSI